MELLKYINHDMVVFDNVTLRLSEVSAFYKNIVPATHAAPEMYVFAILLKGTHDPIFITAADSEDLDGIYNKFISLYTGEE